jgi:TonB family protein
MLGHGLNASSKRRQGMPNKVKIALLALGLTLAGARVLGADDTLIHMHLFRGGWPEGHRGPSQVETWTSANEPCVGKLKEALDSSPSELTAAVIEMLIDEKGLKSLDEYFAWTEKWDGRVGTYSRDIQRQAPGQAAVPDPFGFKMRYGLNRLSAQSIEMKLALFMKPESQEARKNARMDQLLDARLNLEYGEPVMILMPKGPDVFYLLIYTTKAEPADEPRRGRVKKPQTATDEGLILPKAVSTLLPAYPEDLRPVAQGEVGLQVTIDKKGAVAEVTIARSLHPYLDFAAVQAVRQWTFEPATKEGEPVAATVNITMVFDPEKYKRYEEEAERPVKPGNSEQSPGSELALLLDGAAGYCEKLETAALEFICRERIGETHYNFATDPKWVGIMVGSRVTGEIIRSTWFPQWDPQRTIRSNYVCDYLFVRRGERIEERRVVLEDDGKKMPDRNRILEEKRFTALNPVLSVVELLGRGRQSLFNYRIIGATTIQGRNAAILEAIPRSGNSRGVEYAKVWVDAANFEILRSEVQGVPTGGYDDVLRDSIQFPVRPYLLTTHTYEFEKNGIRFPGRSLIRVEYPKQGVFTKDRALKLKIDMRYDKYQFFSVETDGEIRKQQRTPPPAGSPSLQEGHPRRRLQPRGDAT